MSWDEFSVPAGVVDKFAHCEWRSHDELLDDAGCDAGYAAGLAAVVSESELVEVGLKVLRLHGACMRAE